MFRKRRCNKNFECIAVSSKEKRSFTSFKAGSLQKEEKQEEKTRRKTRPKLGGMTNSLQQKNVKILQ